MATHSDNAGPPQLPNLGRDVYKWVQSLDLSYSMKRPRRDCANGFLVAELLSRYFPKDVNMHSYVNGTSSTARNDNWLQIQRACRKHGFQLPKDLVLGCQEERCGAAVKLLEMLYEHLTQKQIRRPQEIPAELAQAVHASKCKSSETDAEEGQFPGVAGASAISKSSKPPGELKFGEIKKRSLDDAMAVRQSLAAS